jgi:hypothetical protein
MKKIFGFALLMVMFFALTSSGKAQFQSQSQEPTHIVHYGDAPQLDTHRPIFKGTTIAIDLREPFRKTAFDELRQLHVGDFIVGKLPCDKATETVICITAQVEGGVSNVAASSYSSGYGSNGGVSNQASFNGSLSNLVVFVTLYRHEADGSVTKLYLGSETTIAPAGSSTEYMSSYGGTSSGSFGYSTTSGLDGSVTKAISDDLTSLFVSGHSWKGFGKKLLAVKFFSPWSPGADTEVEKAFLSAPSDQLQ